LGQFFEPLYLSLVKQQLTEQTATDGSHSDWTEGSDRDDSWTLTTDGGGPETSVIDGGSKRARAGGTCIMHQNWPVLSISGIQIPHGTLAALQRNAAVPKDFTCIVPKLIVVVVQINGHPACALLDSGSLEDFVSTSLADQLKLAKVELTKPLALQLAVQGSRSKVNWGIEAELQYQRIDGKRYFDVANLSNYDLILGTLWLFQHRITMGLNPACVIVGSDIPLPIRGDDVTKIASRAVEVLEESLNKARAELIEYARDLCKELDETDLPPFRSINHEIPLIDEDKIYPW
jgi:hypothetical protein